MRLPNFVAPVLYHGFSKMRRRGLWLSTLANKPILVYTFLGDGQARTFD